MAKSKFEEMFERLPSNIKETEVLRLSTKKVLAALLELLLHSKARESRIIYCPNARLRKLSGVSSNDLLPSLQQLIDYGLITRRVGTARNEGEIKGEASEYTVNLKKLKEPLVEKSFDDLFSEFMEGAESLETPINTAITISNSTANAMATASAMATANTSSNPTNNILIDNDNNILIDKYSNILKEKSLNKNKESNSPSTETSDSSAVLSNCFLDPSDFKEDFTFVEELDKRLAYLRWDNEGQ